MGEVAVGEKLHRGVYREVGNCLYLRPGVLKAKDFSDD